MFRIEFSRRYPQMFKNFKRNVKYTQERRGELNRKTRNVELLFAKRLLWWRKFPRWGYNRELSGWRRNFALVV